jgi:hypothetical protein
LGRLYTYKASADLITLGQIPGAFKGYPYRMKQGVKATALILLVSLLSGCSSAEDKACEAARKSHKDLVYIAGEYNGAAVLKTTPDIEASKLLKLGSYEFNKSQKVIVNNASCFTPEQVAEAQIYLEVRK